MAPALGRLARQLGEAWEVPRDLLLRRYPSFVTGGALPRGHVPVFVFHSLEPERFGRQLAFLADNGYVTLGADQYLDVLLGRAEAPERAVVLTFDDGRGSLWTVGAPLLRERGMRGIVFLVPGRTAARPGPAAPNWDDARAGRVAPAVVLDRERGAGALLSWEEVETLAGDGVFDFESHTLTHARVHVAPRVAGFLTPQARHGYDAFDVPLIADGVGPGAADHLVDEVALGTPLLESAPRTAEKLRFYEDPALRRACVEAVEAGGGPTFFTRPRWERELRVLLPAHIDGRVETPAERETALRHELAEARTAIEAHTGRPVRMLCYPWHAWGPITRRLAEETGHAAAVCGKVPGTPITLPGGDPFAVARVGDDYVELLPGRGRRTITSVLGGKWRRRFGGSGGGA
jgi:peptidoglycan/xylan/chitin deacetylase (PgdA/CDA1 family)